MAEDKDMAAILGCMEAAHNSIVELQKCCEGLVESQRIMNERFAILKQRVDELAMRSRNP